MGIFDFIRKMTKVDPIKEIVIEKLSFSEIEDWIERETKGNELKEKEILLGFTGKIKDLIKDIKVKVVILQGFDIEAKKEKDHIKNIVADSREKYIESVGDLIKKLNNLRENKLDKFIEKINKIFFDFNKSSFKNYERTTILIGKEIASIKESLKIFSKDILKTFDESKPLIDSFKNLLIIKEKLNAIALINKNLEEISKRKLDLSKEITGKEEENRILKQNLEKIKISSTYLENLFKQKKIKSFREDLKKDILELKQLIDFKALTNFFHIFEEQMKIVKDHRENFLMYFEKDNGTSIIELLDEAKLSNKIILEKVKQIKAKIEEIAKHEKNPIEDETQEVFLKINKVNFEIDNLKIEKVKEEKRDEKIKTNKEELISILKQELTRLNVEIV